MLNDLGFDDYIASYPNFPRDGVLFRDIGPLLASSKAMQRAIDAFAEKLSEYKVDLIAGIESRGFLFSTLLASRLEVGSIMIRKPGKLPGKLIRRTYDLEYGSAELVIQETAPVSGRSVVIVDDLLATGGTLLAAKSLLVSCDAEVPVCLVAVELSAMFGRKKIGCEVFALKTYEK